MKGIYIDTNEIQKEFMNSINSALSKFDEAIDICNSSGYENDIESRLKTQKAKCERVRDWVDSSRSMYDDYVDVETDVISKCEVPEFKPRDNVVDANY